MTMITTKNYNFLATCNPAFSILLMKELTEAHAAKINIVRSGVEFSCNKSKAMEICMKSRYAEEIYLYLNRVNLINHASLEAAVKFFKFRSCFDNTKSISVSVVNAEKSPSWLTKTASTISRAIVSYYEDKSMPGLKVRQNSADLHIKAIFQNDTLRMAIRVSGETAYAFHPPYDSGAVTVTPAMAAGIVTMTGYGSDANFIDMTCSSPYLLEAAGMQASSAPPASLYKSFGFNHISGFNSPEYLNLLTEARLAATNQIKIIKEKNLVIRGYTESKSVTEAIKDYFAGHPLKEIISIEQAHISQVTCPARINRNKTFAVACAADKTARISRRDLNTQYAQLSQTMIRQFSGCRAALVLPSAKASENTELMGVLNRYVAKSHDLSDENSYRNLTVLELPARTEAQTDEKSSNVSTVPAMDKAQVAAPTGKTGGAAGTADPAAGGAATAMKEGSPVTGKNTSTVASDNQNIAQSSEQNGVSKEAAAAQASAELQDEQTARNTEADDSDNLTGSGSEDSGSAGNGTACVAAYSAAAQPDAHENSNDHQSDHDGSMNHNEPDTEVTDDTDMSDDELSGQYEQNLELVLDNHVFESMAGELNCEIDNARDIIAAITTLVNDLKNFQDFERGSLTALAHMLNAASGAGQNKEEYEIEADDEGNELLNAMKLLDSNSSISDEQFIMCSRTLNALLGRFMKRLPARYKRNILRNITSRLHLTEDRSSAVFDVLTSMLGQLTLPDKFNPEIITNLISLGCLTATGSTAAPVAHSSAADAGRRANGSASAADKNIQQPKSQHSRPQAGEPVSSIPTAASANGQKIIEKLCNELKCSRMWSINLVEQLHSLGREMSDAQNFDCASLHNFIDSVCLNDDMRRRWTSTAAEQLSLSNDRARHFSTSVEELCISAMSPDGLTIDQILTLFNSMTTLPQEMIKQLAAGMHAELTDLDEGDEDQSRQLHTQCSSLSDSLVRMAFAITRPDSFSLLDSFSEVAENEALRPLWPHLNLAMPQPTEQAVAPEKESSEQDLALQLAVQSEELASRNEELSVMTEQLASMDEELSAMTEQLASKDEELSAMTEELAGLKDELSQIQEELRAGSAKTTQSDDAVHDLHLGVNAPAAELMDSSGAWAVRAPVGVADNKIRMTNVGVQGVNLFDTQR